MVFFAAQLIEWFILKIYIPYLITNRLAKFSQHPLGVELCSSKIYIQVPTPIPVDLIFLRN